MKAYKYLSLLLIVAMLGLSCATVAAQQQEIPGVTDEIKATKPWKITYVIKNTINPFWVRTTEGALSGKDFGVEVTVLAPQKPDNVEEQIRLVEDAISQKVDGIIIAATDTKGLAPVVDKAVEAGIPVIGHNTPTASDKPLTFVGFDNVTAGKTIGAWVAQKLGGQGKVLILEGPPGHQNAGERKQGFLEGLQEGGQFEILDSQTAQWHRSEALRITEDWLQRFPEIDAIIAANDEMALGASEAVQAAGREGIVITGFDANNDALQAIKEGKMHATIDQVPQKQARQAVQLMVQYLESGKTKTFPPKIPWQDITLVSADNIDQFLAAGEGRPFIPGVTDEIKATKPWKITYVIKNTINPFWVRTTEGALSGKDFGVEVTVLAPQKPDNVEEQIRLVEDAISQKVDGIIIAATDTKGLAPVVDKAVEAGIPVIGHNTPTASDKPLTFVGFDNVTAGKTIGAWVAQKLGGQGKVLILEGPPGHQNAGERKQGFLEGLQEGGQFEILDSQTAQWHRSEALRITEDWLQRFPEIDAIIAANDEMALGASEAVQAAGREGIVITGFDANNDALQAIKEGKMHATIDQVPQKQARQAVQLMVQYLESGKTKTFPPKIPWQDITLVSADNIDQFLAAK